MKNRILNSLCVFGLGLAIGSCGNTPKDPQVTTVAHETVVAKPASGNLDEVVAHSQVSFDNENLKEVYAAYLEVKAALVNTNPEQVVKKGAVLETQLKAARANDKALAAARTIASISDIQKQREAFAVISGATEEILKKAIVSGAIYKQFCPMAFDGKGGYWLSNSKEIRNPYFGDKMLKCGMIQETFE